MTGERTRAVQDGAVAAHQVVADRCAGGGALSGQPEDLGIQIGYGNVLGQGHVDTTVGRDDRDPAESGAAAGRGPVTLPTGSGGCRLGRHGHLVLPLLLVLLACSALLLPFCCFCLLLLLLISVVCLFPPLSPRLPPTGFFRCRRSPRFRRAASASAGNTPPGPRIAPHVPNDRLLATVTRQLADAYTRRDTLPPWDRRHASRILPADGARRHGGADRNTSVRQGNW